MNLEGSDIFIQNGPFGDEGKLKMEALIRKPMNLEEGDVLVKDGIFGEEGKMMKGLISKPMNVIFGRNGSGKSSIARYLKSINDDRVKVFDEAYIHDNLRIEENQLGSIVMFGPQVSVQDDISKLKEKINDNKKLQDQLALGFVEIKEKIKQEETQIKNRLNIKDGFTARLSYSQGYVKNTNKGLVELDFVNIISDLVKQKEAEPVDYDKVLDEAYRLQAVGNKKCVECEIPTFEVDRLVERANNLLSRKLSSPSLSEADKHIIEVATNPSLNSYLHDARSILFLPSRPSCCPLCMQPLSNEYLDNLYRKIEEILNKEVEGFEKEIDLFVDSLAILDIDSLDQLNYDRTNLELLKIKAEKALEQIINSLIAKKNSLYESLPLIDDGTYQTLVAYKTELENIKQLIFEHNDRVRNIENLRAAFNQKNLRLAYQELENEITQYEEYIKKRDINVQKGLDYIKENENLNNKLALIQRKPDLNIAAERINEMLDIVFLDSRIKLALKEDGYYSVKVDGHYVGPNMLSTGEQNILALAYFFASLGAGNEEKLAYSDQMLVVVDDPISSFDEGNRLGMTALLGYQFDKIITGNESSKVLVMTHDILTLEDLIKTRDAIFYKIYKNYKEGLDYLKLENKQLIQCDFKGGLYKSLMEDVYNYGFNNATISGIGNMIRRLLETYSSFNYKKGFYLNDKKFLEQVPNLDDHNFLKGMNFRLGLNRESHAYNVAEVHDYIYTEEELRRLARAAIWYLYINDERHIKAYLGTSIKKKLEAKKDSGERVI